MLGAPLIAWDTLTLGHLWNVALPEVGGAEFSGESEFQGIVTVLFEFLDLCIDWGRVSLSMKQDTADLTANDAVNRDTPMAGPPDEDESAKGRERRWTKTEAASQCGVLHRKLSRMASLK